MSYKILGDYIRKVDNKNKDMKILNLQGLSMTKEFRKSTSNIVGTDLSKYKIVKQGQFCCDFMSVIRVHKLPVVLNNLGEDVIISPAYVVFEVIDENLLFPEYLMLWFRRTEFDRYADFRCDSSIRGGFQWEELCEVELPVPSIEKQREIVAQYQAVANKIKVNEQICEKLEATAQTLYKQWFVDFEFPITKESHPELVSGSHPQTYKSSGGNMVYSEELKKEIPKGWEVKSLGDLYKFQYGLGNNNPHNGGEYPVYGSNGIIGFFDKYNSEDAPVIGHIGANCGSLVFGYGKHYVTYNGVICKIKDELYKYYGYRTLQFLDLMSETRGSSQPFISYDILHSLKYFETDETIITDFSVKDSNIFEQHRNLLKQNQKLTQLQSLLLSRLATLVG
ncbi:restriction endonuclease subunit S [Empedobacter falsenii]